MDLIPLLNKNPMEYTEPSKVQKGKKIQIGSPYGKGDTV